MDVRKNAPKTFIEACNLAKQIESAYNCTKFTEINIIINEKNSDSLDICNDLIKLNSESVEMVINVNAEFNNLKLNKIDNAKDEKKFCEICKLNTHNLENCFYNNKNKNNKPRSNTFSKNSDSNIFPRIFYQRENFYNG